MTGAWSEAQTDPRAFTLAGDLALIPFTHWTFERTPYGIDQKGFDTGVMAVRIQPDKLGTPSILRMADGQPVTVTGNPGAQLKARTVLARTPMRALVHNGDVYTLTEAGVAVHAPAAQGTGFTRIAFANF